MLYKTPPKQINVNSSGFSEGFVINHSSIENKTFIRNRIAVYLGGIIAEELVFGEDYKSIGASADIANATDTAGSYVRKYAMDGTISRIIKKEAPQGLELNYNTEKTAQLTLLESFMKELGYTLRYEKATFSEVSAVSKRTRSSSSTNSSRSKEKSAPSPSSRTSKI